MNPLYTIMESRYSWLILAGITLTVACLGAIMMMVYAWPHIVALVWFYAGLIITIGFLVRGLAQRVRAP